MIKVALQPTIYTDLITAMVSGNRPWSVPRSTFYALNGDVVPFSPKPTVIRIDTDRVGDGLNIEVRSLAPTSVGIDPRDNAKSLTVVAQSSVVTLGVQLAPGRNTITVSARNNPEDTASLIVTANPIVTMFEAFSRVLFTNSTRITNEQQLAISSDLATRLIEPFIDFQDLLPDTQSLKIVATRLVARGLVHNVGLESGITDLFKALALNTPVFRNADKETFLVDPTLDPWTRTSSQFAGKEAHLWLPNLEVTSWLAFVKYLSAQPDLFEVLNVREDQVTLRYQGFTQTHQFDFDAFGTSFLTEQAQSQCFKSIAVYMTIASHLSFSQCAASYTFDLYIDEDHKIGDSRGPFDTSVNFDQGYTFDSDPEDPYTDGWVGLSLSGRFEQDYPPTNHCLDTFVSPSSTYADPVCCYEGYYTQLLQTEKYELDLDAEITQEAYLETGVAMVLQDVNSVRWLVYVNADGSLYTVSGTALPLSHWKVTKPDLSEASFSVTILGELLVNSPPDPNAINLNDSLFLLAPSASQLWKLTVDNTNTLVTELVF